MKCIYCLESEPNVSFKGRDHVIPQQLGTFHPENLTSATGGDGFVCDSCNNLFSKLENTFAEDTWEGVIAKMYDIGSPSEIRKREALLKMEVNWDLGTEDFKHAFPTLKHTDDAGWTAVIEAQIVIIYKDERLPRVFRKQKLLRALKDRKIKSAIQQAFIGITADQVHVFAPAEAEHDELIIYLQDYIAYKPISFTPKVEPGRTPELEIKMNATITREIARVLSKIVFNYFACMARAKNKIEVVFDQGFADIRNFILGKEEVALRDVLVSIHDSNYITIQERLRGKPIIAHKIILYLAAGSVYAKLNLMGVPNIYTIKIGTPSFPLDATFRCGHLFNIRDKNIVNLRYLKEHSAWLIDDEGGPIFGFYSKQ